MEMTGDKRIFLDTNVLIYLNNSKHLFHKDVLFTIQSLENESAEFVISDHIIKEFLVAKSNLLKLENRYDEAVLIADYNFLIKSFVLTPSPQNILKKFIHLIQIYKLRGKVIHDAFIAAFCLELGINKIFTLNKKDFLVFDVEGLKIIELRISN